MSVFAGFEVDEVQVRGRKLPKDVYELISDITVDMGTDMVTELTLVFDDPAFKILKSGLFEIDSPIRYRSLELTVSVIETNEGGGLGGLTVVCRPAAVLKLKKLQGKFVMKNVSPSTYIIAECKKAGLKEPVVQESKIKKEIARDVKEKGDKTDKINPPSAWTTFRRLADDIGYLMFEANGRIYFGQPTWLVKRLPKAEVDWYPFGKTEPYSFINFRQSVDEEDVAVELELPRNRISDVFPGRGLRITGFPKFSGTYLITGVNYSIVGTDNIAVSASTVRNPDPQESGDSGGGGGSGNGNGSGNGGSGDSGSTNDGKPWTSNDPPPGFWTGTE